MPPKFLTKAERKIIQDEEDRELIGCIKLSHKFVNKTEDQSAPMTSFAIEDLNMTILEKVLFKDSSITIEHGKRYGLIGSNGSGKSILFKAIHMGLFDFPKDYTVGIVEEECLADGTKVVECFVPKAEVDDFMITFADVKSRAVNKKNKNVEVPKLITVLDGLGFTAEKMTDHVGNLSGGWRMKISLATVLMAEPDLLLLDEPTNMLDDRTIQWLSGFLKEWKTNLFFISHDRSFLSNVATDLLSIENKTVVHYACKYYEWLRNQELDRENVRKQIEEQKAEKAVMMEYIKKFEKTKKKEVAAKRLAIKNLPVIDESILEPREIWRFPACLKIKCATIETSEMGFSYSHTKEILRNITLRVEPDSKICILGDNGCGKTTLLKLFMKILKPTNGNMFLNDKTNVGYFSQHYVDHLEMDKSAIEIMQMRIPNCKIETYQNHLEKFGITSEDWNIPVRCLSSGQKSRVAFSIIYMQKPNFLIFDEPTSHLDKDGTEALEDALRKFKGGVIIVTHDGRLMTNVCNDLWYIQNRTLSTIEDGCKM